MPARVAARRSLPSLQTVVFRTKPARPRAAKADQNQGKHTEDGEYRDEGGVGNHARVAKWPLPGLNAPVRATMAAITPAVTRYASQKRRELLTTRATTRGDV